MVYSFEYICADDINYTFFVVENGWSIGQKKIILKDQLWILFSLGFVFKNILKTVSSDFQLCIKTTKR